MKIAVVSIFKNEEPYILEWLAYYRLKGICDFIIGDNCSDDGSSELLEACDKAGILKREFQPIHKHCSGRGPQLDFYENMIAKYGDDYDLFVFVDADEFIYSESGAGVVETILNIFSDDDISALGINWRLFGTGIDCDKKLVTKRITSASKVDHPNNSCIKTIVRPQTIKMMHCHHAELKQGRYVNSNLDDVEFKDGSIFGAQTNKIETCDLKVAHYIVKSRKEFYEKKKKRGRAGVGVNRDDRERHDSYFDAHSNYKKELFLLSDASDQLLKEINLITSKLIINTDYYSEFDITNCVRNNKVIKGTIKSIGQYPSNIPVVKAEIGGFYEVNSPAIRNVTMENNVQGVYDFVINVPEIFSEEVIKIRMNGVKIQGEIDCNIQSELVLKK